MLHAAIVHAHRAGHTWCALDDNRCQHDVLAPGVIYCCRASNAGDMLCVVASTHASKTSGVWLLRTGSTTCRRLRGVDLAKQGVTATHASLLLRKPALSAAHGCTTKRSQFIKFYRLRAPCTDMASTAACQAHRSSCRCAAAGGPHSMARSVGHHQPLEARQTAALAPAGCMGGRRACAWTVCSGPQPPADPTS